MTSRYRRIWNHAKRYRSLLLLGAGALVAGAVLQIGAPRLLGSGINALKDTALDAATAVETAKRQVLFFLLLSVGSGAMMWATRRLLIGASRRIERDLKREVFDHIESLPASFFDRTRIGDLMSRLTSDVEAVRFPFGPGVMYVGRTLVIFPLALLSMGTISLPLTIATLAPLVLIMGVVRLIGPGIMKRSRAVQDQVGLLSARAQENFAGARVVRAYATETLEVDAFENENETLVHESVALARYRAMMMSSIYLLGGLAQLAVVWYGGTLYVEGQIELGDLVTFLSYVGMLMWPMISVGWVVSALQRAAAAMERLDEVLDAPAESSTLGAALGLREPARGALEVEGLTFTYPGTSSPALEDIDLDVPAGTTLGVVGPVGAGKSTLLRVLPRLYEPPPGTIRLDGQDVSRVPLDVLRRQFSIVPQDAFLFSDTLRANLAYAVEEELTPARARLATEQAGLASDLENMPKGLETVVGERGLTLSGGQKQRTTLARGLLRESPVLLLDDCLSAVDTETESRILEGLRDHLRRRTAVIVAHRLSTVRHADQIVVLDAGRIVERGTHDELLEVGGWYAETFERQRLEGALEDLA